MGNYFIYLCKKMVKIKSNQECHRLVMIWFSVEKRNLNVLKNRCCGYLWLKPLAV